MEIGSIVVMATECLVRRSNYYSVRDHMKTEQLKTRNILQIQSKWSTEKKFNYISPTNNWIVGRNNSISLISSVCEGVRCAMEKMTYIYV